MAEMSAGNLDELLKILTAAKVLETGDPTATAMFNSADELLKTIEAIPFSELPWTTFHVKYTGPVTPTTPTWKLQTYVVYTWNPLQLAEQMAQSADFFHTWDYIPYEEYLSEECRTFSNVMSGRWAFKKAVSNTVSFNYCNSLPLAESRSVQCVPNELFIRWLTTLSERPHSESRPTQCHAHPHRSWR